MNDAASQVVCFRAEAIQYAERRKPILPLFEIERGACACGSTTCKAGKHPRTAHGLNDATTDIATIESWWLQWPNANIGGRTGPESGWVVLDEDTGKGLESLRSLVGRFGPLPETALARTGSGGFHHVFQHPGVYVPSRAGTMAPGLDVRGNGGYIVLPPSVHLLGQYEWIRAPWECEPAPIPEWLLELMLEKPSRPTPKKARARQSSGSTTAHGLLHEQAAKYVTAAVRVPHGERNDDAFNLAGHLRAFVTDEGDTLSEGEIVELMAPWNASLDEPLDEAELVRCVRSAFEGNGTPRQPHIVHTKRKLAAMNVAEEQQSLLERDRARWKFIPASQLDATDEKVDWVVEGVIARGYTTILSAHPKAGKTTLLATLLRNTDRGGSLIGAVHKCKVRIITEEHSNLWAQRRTFHAYSDDIQFGFLPFVMRPNMTAWVEYIRSVEAEVRKEGIGLVVFDTISRFWPCKEENSATEIADSIAPLELLKEAGAAVLLIHHLRKSDGAESTGSRGSGALMAMVDVIVELRRLPKAKPSDKRRVLTVSGRFSNCPPETVLDYRDGVYVSIGSRADVSQADRLETIRSFLDGLPDGVALKKEEIQEQLLKAFPGCAVGERLLGKDLKIGFEKQMWLRFGSGKKNDAYRYAVRALTGEVGAQRIEDPKIRCAHTHTLKSVHRKGESQ